jgi:MFS family permease
MPLGALIGSSQVGARIIEMLIGRYHHPIWTLLASTVFVAVGLAISLAGLPVVAAALVLYGAGMGIKSIAQGTLPLALFGATGYAALMGRLAMPSLVAQSISPLAGALLLEHFGAGRRSPSWRRSRRSTSDRSPRSGSAPGRRPGANENRGRHPQIAAGLQSLRFDVDQGRKVLTR